MSVLFIHYSYNGDSFEPTLTLLPKGAAVFDHLAPRTKTLTLNFDTTQRFCTGWHNLETAQSFPCPDTAALPAQFGQCRHCQNKTGFNPAFYHAASVSPQQQARNAQPHFLYLAHFAPGVMKVGISWAQRGIRRLLDQGARSALIIKTYPTATVARQYEAKIAGVPGIAETLQVKKKHSLLGQTYNHQTAADELLKTRHTLAQTFGITPEDNQPLALDNHYFKGTQLNSPIILHTEQKISGRCLGMIGSTLVTEQNGQQFGLCVNNFTGYPVTITEQEEPNTFQPQQASLF